MLKGLRVMAMQALARPAKSAQRLPQQEVGSQIKVRKGTRATPSYMSERRMDPSQAFQDTDRNIARMNLARMGRNDSTKEMVRQMIRTNPSMSNAAAGHLRLGLTRNFTVVGYTPEGTIDRDTTQAALQTIRRLNNSPDFDGATINKGIRAISESLGYEILITGALAAELVLDDMLFPDYIQPVSTNSIQLFPKGTKLKPKQVVGQDEIDLDIPTFFYMTLDRDLTKAYPDSPFESAVKPAQFINELIADITRVARQAVHPRIKITVIEEKIRANAPPEVVSDPELMQQYIDSEINNLASVVNTLSPEDALVFYDSIDFEYLNNGNSSVSREWAQLNKMSNVNMSTSLRTPPTILGQHEGSSNIASAEIQLFVKQIEGAIQLKLNEFYSQILTLCVRLMGFEGYVTFTYDPVELRTPLESETFLAQKSSRLLENLSLGIITDDEYALAMFGRLSNPDAPLLSGTMFRSANPPTDDPYVGESNKGSTLNKDLDSGKPKGVAGQNRKSNPLKEAN